LLGKTWRRLTPLVILRLLIVLFQAKSTKFALRRRPTLSVLNSLLGRRATSKPPLPVSVFWRISTILPERSLPVRSPDVRITSFDLA
jgi:hypothetical protein